MGKIVLFLRIEIESRFFSRSNLSNTIFFGQKKATKWKKEYFRPTEWSNRWWTFSLSFRSLRGMQTIFSPFFRCHLTCPAWNIKTQFVLLWDTSLTHSLRLGDLSTNTSTEHKNLVFLADMGTDQLSLAIITLQGWSVCSPFFNKNIQ